MYSIITFMVGIAGNGIALNTTFCEMKTVPLVNELCGRVWIIDKLLLSVSFHVAVTVTAVRQRRYCTSHCDGFCRDNVS